jgi:exosome complex component CSL4
MALPSLALTGQLLGPVSKYTPGPGTHIYNSSIYASISGPVVSSYSPIANPSKAPWSRYPAALPTLSITRNPPPTTSFLRGGASVLPEVDSTVLCRVTRLGARFASVEILVVGELVCREPFSGMIRKEDVRATEKDRVVVRECFRVGDVVRGVVISLGDQSNYYISTAKNEYGVVMAWAHVEAGESAGGGGAKRAMYPVSWKDMRDPVTGLVEVRKVAKPF